MTARPDVVEGTTGIRGRRWRNTKGRPNPIDNALDDARGCGEQWAETPGLDLECTRPHGHDGIHQACGIHQTVIVEWPVDDELTERTTPALDEQDMASLNAYLYNLGRIYDATRDMTARYMIDTGDVLPPTPAWDDLPIMLRYHFSAQCPIPDLMQLHRAIGIALQEPPC